MKRKSGWGNIWAMAFIVGLGVSTETVFADPLVDTFWCEIYSGGPSPVFTGGGSGYDFNGDQTLGDWLLYANPTPPINQAPEEEVPWWVNQWYYDHPLMLDHMKVITVDFDFSLIDPLQPYDLSVALNWTTPNWPPDPLPDLWPPPVGRPPLPTEEVGLDGTRNIERWAYDFEGQPGHVSFEYTIWDYNPEWISIDLSGFNVSVVNGVITHECMPVPEPATLTLLGLGLGGMLVQRLRKKM